MLLFLLCGVRERELARRGIGAHGGQVCGAEMAIDPFFGSVLAAAANIGGGLVGGGSSRKANELAEEQATANRQAQLTAMQHGITWRAQDVMNAYKSTGIHPLALLGVQGPTYSPVSSAFTTSPVGESIGRAGQDISRGMHATADRELRGAAIKVQQDMLGIARERGTLENELIRTQIASERARLSQVSAPPMPSPNQRWSLPGVADTTMLHRDIALRRDPSREDSSTPGVGYLSMPDGSLMPVKSKEAQERLEDDVLGNLKHFVQRELGPSFWERDPGRAASPGMRWTVNLWGNWVQVPKSTATEPGMPWLRSRGYGTYRR